MPPVTPKQNIHCLLGVDSTQPGADEFLNVIHQRWTSVGVHEEQPEGRESIIPFSPKLGFHSNESVIPHDSRTILIIIFIVTSKMWRNEVKTYNTIF